MINNKVRNLLSENDITDQVAAIAIGIHMPILKEKLDGIQDFKASEMISITYLINSVSGKHYTLQDIFA